MKTEQLMLNNWRKLQPDKQQEVIDFINFLEYRSHFGQEEAIKQEAVEEKPLKSLGAKLRQVRQEIVDSGLPLLNAEEIEREKAERRGGYQGDEE